MPSLVPRPPLEVVAVEKNHDLWYKGCDTSVITTITDNQRPVLILLLLPGVLLLLPGAHNGLLLLLYH